MHQFLQASARILIAITATLAFSAESAAATATDARVLPLPGVFWDEGNGSAASGGAIDREFMKTLPMPATGAKALKALQVAFNTTTTAIDPEAAGDTFAASFHLTRMATYSAKKADGNIELHTPVTGSIYFTNVLTGDVLYTVTGTHTAVASVSAKELAGAGKQAQSNQMYASAFDALLLELSKQAAASFKPHRIEAAVVGIANGLCVLNGGFHRGIQRGDNLEDDHSNLVRVIYSAGDYSVVKVILPLGGLPPAVGVNFHKFAVGKDDGRERPSVAILVDKFPEGFSSDYLAQLVAEELGDKAPLTIVQVNRNFKNLLAVIAAADGAQSNAASDRVPPSLIIRLRVGDPLYYETTTNLTFQTVRRFEAHAYAEIIDTSGRVLYAASGHDSQKISVTNGLDLDPNARLEIAVKNALLSLAEDVGKLAEARQDSSPVRQANEQGVLVATADKSLPAGMAGFVLRPTELVVAGKKVKFNVPIAESHVDRRVGTDTKLKGLMKINQMAPVTAAGDLWEVMQLGPTPRSPRSFGLCADGENLGSVATPDYEGIVSIATAKGMPGAYYAPEIKTAADKIISAQTGFRDGISWDMPELSSCIQPVQRVDVLGEKCDKDGTCQSQVSRRFTLRFRSADTVVLKEGSESKGTTDGYGKTTKPAELSKLVQSDAIDEAHRLLESIVQKLNLNVIAN